MKMRRLKTGTLCISTASRCMEAPDLDTLASHLWTALTVERVNVKNLSARLAKAKSELRELREAERAIKARRKHVRSRVSG